NGRIRKITADGIINTIAGVGSAGFAGDGGPSISAQINEPSGIAFDSGGSLYIADTGNNRVRKVSPSGTMTTVAGHGAPGFTGDGGLATAAELQRLSGVTVDTSGNLYIAVAGAVRKATTDGIIQTVVGQGGIGCSSPSTAICINPTAIAVDAARNLYIADLENAEVMKMTLDGKVTAVAGGGTSGLPTGDGPATSAQL